MKSAPIFKAYFAVKRRNRRIFWTLTGLHAVQLLLAFLLVPETGGKAERTGGLDEKDGESVPRARERGRASGLSAAHYDEVKFLHGHSPCC